MTAAHADAGLSRAEVVASVGADVRPTLSVQETASFLGISRWLVQQAVRNGELPHVRIGRRILIPRGRLLAMLAGEPSSAADRS